MKRRATEAALLIVFCIVLILCCFALEKIYGAGQRDFVCIRCTNSVDKE